MNARQRKKIAKRQRWGKWNGKFWMGGRAYKIADSPRLTAAHRAINDRMEGEHLMQAALSRGRSYAARRCITPSSGCIWADLGLEPPTPEQEAEALESMRRSAAATQGLLDYYAEELA